jgi:hypothetical protein
MTTNACGDSLEISTGRRLAHSLHGAAKISIRDRVPIFLAVEGGFGRAKDPGTTGLALTILAGCHTKPPKHGPPVYVGRGYGYPDAMYSLHTLKDVGEMLICA